MRETGRNRVVARTQREVLRRVMLADAPSCWLTLKELARRTRYAEASISAQLRHLCKLQFGGFLVEKRHRDAGCAGPERGTVWEYRLGRKARGAARRSGHAPG